MSEAFWFCAEQFIGDSAVMFKIKPLYLHQSNRFAIASRNFSSPTLAFDFLRIFLIFASIREPDEFSPHTYILFFPFPKGAFAYEPEADASFGLALAVCGKCLFSEEEYGPHAFLSFLYHPL